MHPYSSDQNTIYDINSSEFFTFLNVKNIKNYVNMNKNQKLLFYIHYIEIETEILWLINAAQFHKNQFFCSTFFETSQYSCSINFDLTRKLQNFWNLQNLILQNYIKLRELSPKDKCPERQMIKSL